MVFIKIAVVLIFIFAGFNYVKPENWTPFAIWFRWCNGWSDYSILAFIGFDAVSTAKRRSETSAT